MASVDRYSSDSLRRLLGSLNSVTFKDEDGQIEYFGQKVVILRRDAFQLMKSELAARNAGGTISLILGIVGRRVGGEEAKAFKSQAGFQELSVNASTPDLIRRAVEDTNMGYGKMLIRELGISAKTAIISVRNCFEAEKSARRDASGCFFTLGYLEGLFSELIGSQLRGVETNCVGKGDESCIFELGPTFEKSQWKL